MSNSITHTHRNVAGILILAAVIASALASHAADRPNIVLIMTDDQGYGDVGVYGAEGFTTPHLDRLAAEGIRFTDFYVPQGVCTSSRAALMTGCYPNRIGLVGAFPPWAKHGIHDQEVTLGEITKQVGYVNGVVGKWHLGHHPQFLPTRHGFDSYLGLAYSNDMWPHHPDTEYGFPPLPLLENETVIDEDVTAADQAQLTTMYTERAVAFIEDNKDRPFFLYVPHTMPHVPLFVSDKFAGRSEIGIYGDVMMELDWSVGHILAALDRHGLKDNTLVIFLSDNGPSRAYGNHGGSSGPLYSGKATTWEGGIRVPFIARWPGRIPAGAVCREPAMSFDIFPTIAGLLDAKLPDHKIDGKDIWPLLSGQPGAKSPHEALFFYWLFELHAVRSGKWSMHVPHPYRTLKDEVNGFGKDGKPGAVVWTKTPLALFDLEADIGQTTNIADRHPDVVARLMKHIEQAREDLGDKLTDTAGAGRRPLGSLR